jgi:hypothetical protein
MLEEIPNGLQSLHFDILTLSPTKANLDQKVVKGKDNLAHKAHNVCIIH